MWSLVAGLAVNGMYQWLGSDKVPIGPIAQSGVADPFAVAAAPGARAGAQGTVSPSSFKPTSGAGNSGQERGSNVNSALAMAGSAAASAGGMVMTATGLAPAGSPAAVAASRSAKAGNLAFLPGSEVLDGGDGDGAGAPAGSWSATIATTEPLATAVSYYREQLASRRQPTDPPINEVTPGPGQTLLSLASQKDGAHHAVWIGQADGKVLIRLVRTLPEGN